MSTCNRSTLARRDVLRSMGALAAGGTFATASSARARAASKAECGPWTQPSDEDFADIVGQNKSDFVDRVLAVIEDEIVPKTQEGVRAGNKLFGAAILRKDDLSTVVASTNTETGNPLLHGEIQAINTFYALPKDQRPKASETIFVATHEPCPLCLSGISWGGFDNHFYLFTYEDSRDAYGIPHDIDMLQQVFRCPEGSYNEKNTYWSAWGIRDLIAALPADDQARFGKRVEGLKAVYADMSGIYQRAKAEGRGADVPLR